MINAPEENDIEKKRYLYDQVKVESKVKHKPYLKVCRILEKEYLKESRLNPVNVVPNFRVVST